MCQPKTPNCDLLILGDHIGSSLHKPHGRAIVAVIGLATRSSDWVLMDDLISTATVIVQ